ncbi:MAG: DNA-3-methyladenine glycosylase I [Porticoccus sp.]|jgi:DNA-3-methyladenine glycosylase I
MPASHQTQLSRCDWCLSDALYQHYHDSEWGVPCTEDQKLFEFLILESAQAGLSWITILRKRGNYRRAFSDFRAERVARFNTRSIERLLCDPGIVRNKLKIKSAINNAQKFLEVQQQAGSFSNYLWGFVDGAAIQNYWMDLQQVPSTTPLSEIISKDMKQRGFQFFGKTICYAYMQAIGMVNDHTVSCFRHGECQGQI